MTKTSKGRSMRRLTTSSLLTALILGVCVAAVADGDKAASEPPKATKAADKAAPTEAPAPTASELVSRINEDRKALLLEQELKKLDTLDKEYRHMGDEVSKLRKSLRRSDDRPRLASPSAAAAPKASTATPATKPAPTPTAASAKAPQPPKLSLPSLATARIVSGSEEKLANALFRLGRFEDALEAYRRALKLVADDRAKGWCSLQIGMCSTYLGDRNAAVAAFGGTVEKFPESYWAKQAQWQLDALRWAKQWTAKTPAKGGAAK